MSGRLSRAPIRGAASGHVTRGTQATDAEGMRSQERLERDESVSRGNSVQNTEAIVAGPTDAHDTALEQLQDP